MAFSEFGPAACNLSIDVGLDSLRFVTNGQEAGGLGEVAVDHLMFRWVVSSAFYLSKFVVLVNNHS